VEAVTEAGELALSMFRAGVRSWAKADASPVTEADLAVDELLKSRLHELVPDCAWLSEETADAPLRLNCRRVVVVDPIDGTRAFMAGLPDWVVAAALVEDSRPVAAALYAPATDELFTAALNRGACHNGAPIRVNEPGARDGLRIAGPKSGIGRLRHTDLKVVDRTYIHSLALRFARVATGEFDAAFASGRSRDWDLAAADLLVHEAGGVLASFDGNKPVYNQPDAIHGPLVAAGAQFHPILLAALNAAPKNSSAPAKGNAEP
jgi:myo-inositol-1(or 4)-monophosphatase